MSRDALEMWEDVALRVLHSCSVRSDAERCFRYNAFYERDNHFVFVGDSRVRQLYQATRRLVETGQDPQVGPK